MNTVILICLLAGVIIVHEIGHFLTAKFFGIRVKEFGIGYPPRIFAKKWKDTEYSLNWLPFGGFVKMAGEEISEGEGHGHGTADLFGKPKYAQAIVMVAGVVCNLLLAWIIISSGYLFGTPVSTEYIHTDASVENYQLIISDVKKGSPAERAGIKGGDVIISIAVGAVEVSYPSTAELQEIVKNSGGEEIVIGYWRPEDSNLKAILHAEKAVDSQDYAIGVAMNYLGFAKLGLVDSFVVGMKDTARITVLTANGLAGIFTNIFQGESGLKNLSGPIGIVKVMNDSVSSGWNYVFNLIALISINLAIINMIPFPALDGGWLLFSAIEWVRGRPVSRKTLGIVYGFGYLVLFLLMIAVTYNDIIRIIS